MDYDGTVGSNPNKDLGQNRCTGVFDSTQLFLKEMMYG
jgi:hypothetical protein